MNTTAIVEYYCYWFGIYPFLMPTLEFFNGSIHVKQDVLSLKCNRNSFQITNSHLLPRNWRPLPTVAKTSSGKLIFTMNNAPPHNVLFVCFHQLKKGPRKLKLLRWKAFKISINTMCQKLHVEQLDWHRLNIGNPQPAALQHFIYCSQEQGVLVKGLLPAIPIPAWCYHGGGVCSVWPSTARLNGTHTTQCHWYIERFCESTLLLSWLGSSVTTMCHRTLYQTQGVTHSIGPIFSSSPAVNHPSS